MKNWQTIYEKKNPLFFFSKERQKELETYNIYSERFLRGLANRRTGKQNREAFNKICFKLVNSRYLR